jgi:hypothetical protein
MAHSRLQLHDLLKTITEYVYFQPPPNIQMQYPCILYSRDGSSVDHANNELYRHAKRYQVTVIDRDPDTALSDMVEKLKFSRFDRFFAVDDLNHFVFTLFF